MYEGVIEMYLGYFTKDEEFPFFIQYGYHETPLDFHKHTDFLELVIVLSGSAMHHVNNDDAYFIKKGDVFVLGDGVSHAYTETNQLKICNIMFRPELLGDMKDVRTLSGFHALFVIEPYLTTQSEFQSHLTLTLENYEKVRNYTDIMLSEYQEDKPGRKTLLTAYFTILVTFLSRIYDLPEKKTNASILNIAKSVSFMENHYMDNISIDEIAAISNLSPRHFSRLFTASYEITPGNYILSLRLQHACNLLKHSTQTVTEIAFASGFHDNNYFSRQFHKKYQISPRDYRKRYQVEI